MLIYDLETDGLLDAVTTIHCLHLICTDNPEAGVQRYNDHDYKAAGTVSEGVERLAAADEILAHNGLGFDHLVLDKLYPSWNLVKKPKRLDSIIMSSVIFPEIKDADFKANRAGYWQINGKKNPKPEKMGGVIGSHSLKAWGLRLGNNKDDYDPRSECPEGTSLGDAWRTVGWTESMDDYCVQDVLVTYDLWKLLDSKDYSQQCLDLEHKFATLMKLQERNGFTLDVAAGKRLHQELLVRRDELGTELKAEFPCWYDKDGSGADRIPKVNNGPRGETKGVPFTKVVYRTFNPSSTQQIADRLQKVYGWKPTVFSEKGDVSCTDEVLASLNYPFIPALREYLTIAKRLGQLAEGTQAILRKVQDDGRIHGRVSTNGASTGRCTHSSPNVAQTPSVSAPYGAQFRSLYTAASGFKLVGCDASGLELRILGHYMARFDGGEYAREVVGGDVHWLNLQAIGVADGPMNDSAEHKAARNAVKTWVYGYLYGAGEALSGIHYTAAHAAYNGIAKPKQLSGRKSRKAFKENLPALASLEDGVKAAANQRGWLKGLDGRKIPVRSEHSALNALLQSGGAVLMKQYLVVLSDMLALSGLTEGVDYGYCANVHDETQIEVRDVDGLPERVATLCETALVQAGEDLGLNVRIDGEAKIGNTWADTH